MRRINFMMMMLLALLLYILLIYFGIKVIKDGPELFLSLEDVYLCGGGILIFLGVIGIIDLIARLFN
jgi:hypothetical protein